MLTVEKSWVNVQQKTFTKWLNDKIKVRGILIDDLVTDLSDGVSVLLGHPHPSPRNPRRRIPRPLCFQAQASRAKIRECQQESRLHQREADPDDEYRSGGYC